MPSSATSSCPLCLGGNLDPEFTGVDFMIPRDETFPYVRCRDCQLVFIDPIPDSERIATFYGSDYAPHQPINPAQFERQERRLINRFMIRYRCHANARRSNPLALVADLLSPFAMAKNLPPHGSNRVLDVGCGSGRWLYRHHRMGWHAEGVEFVPDVARQARTLGMTVYEGTVFDVPADHRYDVVSFRHVMEHVPNPRETLARARELLAEGGQIHVSVPNIDSWGYQRFGVDWYGVDAPRHLLHFSPANLRRLGEETGLRTVSLTTEIGNWVHIISEHNRHTLGPDFATIGRDERAPRIAACHENLRAWRKAHKWQQRLLWCPCLLQAWRGHGETMRIVYEKA